jgi:hypothetical protein
MIQDLDELKCSYGPMLFAESGPVTDAAFGLTSAS